MMVYKRIARYKVSYTGLCGIKRNSGKSQGALIKERRVDRSTGDDGRSEHSFALCNDGKDPDI